MEEHGQTGSKESGRNKEEKKGWCKPEETEVMGERITMKKKEKASRQGKNGMYIVYGIGHTNIRPKVVRIESVEDKERRFGDERQKSRVERIINGE